MKNKSALVIGASGMVGTALMKVLGSSKTYFSIKGVDIETDMTIKSNTEIIKEKIPKYIKGTEAKQIYPYLKEKKRLMKEYNMKIAINPKVVLTCHLSIASNVLMIRNTIVCIFFQNCCNFL